MKYSQGTTICNQGMPADYKYYVVSGYVKELIDCHCFKITREGEFLTLTQNDDTIKTTAIAITDCEVEYCKEVKEEGERDIILKELFDQIEYLHMLIDIRKKGVIAKVCSVIFLLEGFFLEGVKLTREDLSDISDCAKETFIRALSDLRDAGFVDTKRGITVLNRMELEKIIAQDIEQNI